MSSSSLLNIPLHQQYFIASLRHLPEAYSSLDTNRLTLAHFSCHALDLLGAWTTTTTTTTTKNDNNNNNNEKNDISTDDQTPSWPSSSTWRQTVIDWIYSLQVESGGFMGGHFLGETEETKETEEGGKSSSIHGLGGDNDDDNEATSSYYYRHGHIAMSYTALTLLRLLGDDWSRLNRQALLQSMQQLQLSNGSFRCVPNGSESDLRFLYCACCVSHMLKDWSGVNVPAAVNYIQSCRSFDGAMGLLPGQEGHGGSTFCAVASLVLMHQLDNVLQHDNWYNELIHWCVHRQVRGMQGRPNKDEDTCYSYWIGGTLQLLGMDHLLDHDQLRSFVFQCQTKMGGFSKVRGVYPDLLHAYYSLAYLSLSQQHLDSLHLRDVNCTLGIGNETAQSFWT